MPARNRIHYPVRNALTAAEVGGVTAMHDATECGVWGGLVEIAEASGVGLRIDQDAIPVQPVVQRTCEYFKIDPFSAISEGTLLLTCDPSKAGAIVSALSARQIPATVAGEVVARDQGLTVTSGGRSSNLEHPGVDPFWIVFAEYSRRRAEEGR